MAIISLDWLSGTSTLTRPLEQDLPPGFRLNLEKLSTKVFNKWFTLWDRGNKVADLLIHPKTPIINPLTCHWKLSNSYLYSFSGASSKNNILTLLGLTSVRPTRVDVCADFVLFQNNLTPGSFITQVVRGMILRKHGGRFKVEGTQARVPKFHYLRYGSTTSPVSIYLYNKSKEMREKEYKPWIYNKWQKLFADVTPDVWRLEFSVKDTRLNFVDTETGEKVSIHDIQPFYYPHHELLFKACLKKYGQFVRNDYKANISRMKVIDLLPVKFNNTAIYIGNTQLSHNNLQKFTIKQLLTLENDLRLSKMLSSNHIVETIHDFERRHGLTGYSDYLKNLE